MSPEQFVAQVRETFEAHRNPAKAAPMAKYMKNRFPFLGLPRPDYQALAKPLLQSVGKTADEPWLLEVARLLWELPEREYQYLAVGVLRAGSRRLGPGSLEVLERLLTHKTWWDSVDGLAAKVVGPLVLRYPELKAEMDRWSRHHDFWLRRAAILHQLGYKEKTDPERLFAYCAANAADREFFIRKGIGWALREYAKTDPEAVWAFVAAHPGLSPLSKREALKHARLRV
jgi:3-methyladenine DNA glycosylase AlkD